MQRKIQLLLIAFFTLGFIYAQSDTSYLSLYDHAGIQPSSFRLEILESEADSLVASLPEGIRDSFGVFDAGFYLHNSEMANGTSEFFESIKITAASVKPYFLLLAREYEYEGSTDVKLWVSVRLPEYGDFSCMKDSEVPFFVASLQKTHSALQAFQAEADIIRRTKDFIKDRVDCCVGSRARTEICASACEESQQQFEDYLAQELFDKRLLDVTFGSYTPYSDVFVRSNYIIDAYPNLSDQLHEALQSLDELAGMKAYIMDRSDLCDGYYEDIKEDQDNLLIVIIDSERGEVFVRYKIVDCLSIIPQNRLEALLEVSLHTALYKLENPGCYDIVAWAVAYYRVCLLDQLHWLLTATGIICDVCDIVDAGIYVLEGDNANASLSMVGAIPLLGSPAKLYIKITGSSGRKIALVFSKYGVRHFGRASQLATVIGKQAGKAAHHIIPWELFQKFDNEAIKLLVSKGFHPNQVENGINLVTKIKGTNWAGEVIESAFHANHPAYTTFVRKRLDEIAFKYGGDATKVLDEVASNLIPLLKKHISDAEKYISTNPNGAGKTLNDYFKLLK